MPRNEDFNYSGIKASHSGGWSAQDYHDHNKVHSDKLRKTSEERQMKPRPRSRDFGERPKPTTKVLNLATGKATELNEQINNANQNDLKKRGIK